MLLSQILFEIVAGAICLHFLFNEPPNNDFVGERARCLITAEASPKDLFLRELCLRTPIARVVCLLLFLLIWIIQMCKCFTVVARERCLQSFSHSSRGQHVRRRASRRTVYQRGNRKGEGRRGERRCGLEVDTCHLIQRRFSENKRPREDVSTQEASYTRPTKSFNG